MEINLSLYQVIQVTISVMKIKIGIFMNVKNLIFKIKK